MVGIYSLEYIFHHIVNLVSCAGETWDKSWASPTLERRVFPVNYIGFPVGLGQTWDKTWDSHWNKRGTTHRKRRMWKSV